MVVWVEAASAAALESRLSRVLRRRKRGLMARSTLSN